MTERELYLRKSAEVIERLKERGIVPPAMPEGSGQEMVPCPVCKGEGGKMVTAPIRIVGSRGWQIVDEQTKLHCKKCGGSGFEVRNNLLEWGKRIQGMIQWLI